MNLHYRNTKWLSEYHHIKKDYSNLVELLIKNKPCGCDSEKTHSFCKHFNRIVIATFGKRYNELMRERSEITSLIKKEMMNN